MMKICWIWGKLGMLSIFGTNKWLGGMGWEGKGREGKERGDCFVLFYFLLILVSLFKRVNN